jgi:hypothetical protein
MFQMENYFETFFPLIINHSNINLSKDLKI